MIRPRTIYTLEVFDDGGAILSVSHIGPRIRDSRPMAQAEFTTTPDALARLALYFQHLADIQPETPTTTKPA